MREPIVIKAGKGEYLSELLPFKESGIPSNSILCKGRTGIGATSLEISFDRHSIIAVPTVPVILNKLGITEMDDCVAVGNKFPIFGGDGMNPKKRLEATKSFLLSDIKNKKIFVTPDSFHYIITAARALKIEESVYRDFFLFVDEFHCYSSEAFRLNITDPFDHFWDFENKSFVSATPFDYRESNFDKLDYYKIEITEQIGKIDLVITDDVDSTLNYLLTHEDLFTGNVHIFYNAVKSLGDVIRSVITRSKAFDCNIFCAPKKENIATLDELRHLINPSPQKDSFKKFNFYTSRYFEGWDLFDDNATIILVSDIHKPNTRVGVSVKGVQAVGRLRSIPNQVIHISNTYNLSNRRTIDELYKQVNFDSEMSVRHYNENYQEAYAGELLPADHYKTTVLKYAKIDDNAVAKEHSIKKIQMVYTYYSFEEFLNADYLIQAWEDANYGVELRQVVMEFLPNFLSLKANEQVKLLCTKFDDLKNGRYLNQMIAKERIERLAKGCKYLDLAHQAYEHLGMEVLESNHFDLTFIRRELHKKSYQVVKSTLIEELENYNKKSIKRSEAKIMLQNIYDNCNHMSVSGKSITAKATDFNKLIADINVDLSATSISYNVIVDKRNVKITKNNTN